MYYLWLQEVARLEAEKAQLSQQKEAVFSSREVLQDKVMQLKQEVGTAATAIDQAETELVTLLQEVSPPTSYRVNEAPKL